MKLMSFLHFYIMYIFILYFLYEKHESKSKGSFFLILIVVTVRYIPSRAKIFSFDWSSIKSKFNKYRHRPTEQGGLGGFVTSDDCGNFEIIIDH